MGQWYQRRGTWGHRLAFDLWFARDNRFLNPESSYGRILTAPPCRLIRGPKKKKKEKKNQGNINMNNQHPSHMYKICQNQHQNICAAPNPSKMPKKLWPMVFSPIRKSKMIT